MAFSCHIRGCLVCQDPRLLSPRPSIRAPLVLIKTCGSASEGCYTAITGILPPASENHTLFPSLGETSPLRANVLPQREGVRGDERESHGEIEKEKRQRRLGCVDAHLHLSLWMSVFVSETVHQANKVR